MAKFKKSKKQKEIKNSYLNDLNYERINFSEWIFSKKNNFEIPFFQREYEWEEIQIINLFWDVVYRSKDHNEHSMGFIQVNEKTKKIEINNKKVEEETKIRIIDGQQRITTFLIFTKVFLDIIRESSAKTQILKKINNQTINESKFSSNYYGVILRKFFNNEKLSKIEEKSTIYKILKSNYKILKDQIKKESNDEIGSVLKWWESFIKYFFIVIIKWNIEDTNGELEIFKNLNSKGKPLGTHDLVKVYLINKLDENLFAKCENEKKITSLFKNNFGNIKKLQENFYRSYIKYYCALNKQEELDASKLSEKFNYHFVNNGKMIDDSCWSMKEFESKIKEIGKFFLFEKLLRGKELNGTGFHNFDLFKETEIHSIEFRKPAMHSLLFYLLDKYLKVEEEGIPEFKDSIIGIEELESFVKTLKILELYKTRHYIFINNVSLEKYFTSMIIFLEKSSKDVNFLKKIPKKMWEYFNSKEKYPIISQEVFERKLKQEKLQPDAIPSVFRKIDFIFCENNDSNNFTKTKTKQKNPTIEHIAPQTGTKAWFVKIGANGDEYMRRINFIGNLLLIPWKINIKSSNKSFKDKLSVYREKIVNEKVHLPHMQGFDKIDDYVLKSIFDYENEWNWETIQERTKQLAKILANYVFKDPEF